MGAANKRFPVLGASLARYREQEEAKKAAALRSAQFPDTGISGTRAQVETYNRLVQLGRYDANAPYGSASNPYGQRLNSSIPEGAHYVDLEGVQQLAPQGGVQLTGPRNVTAGLRPPAGSAPMAERMLSAQPY